MLTQERLKELLRYDPYTGIFTWKIKQNNSTKIGGRAGSERSAGKLCDRYRSITIDKVRFYETRLAFLYMEGEHVNKPILHIDGDKLNNKFNNLKIATLTEIRIKSCVDKNSRTGHVGVHYGRSVGKYIVRIKNNGKNKHVGVFETIEDAIEARKLAEKKFWGEETERPERMPDFAR